MEWFIFALLAPILWGGCNIIDKFLLEKYIKNPISYQIFTSLFDILSIVIIFSLFHVSINFYGFILGITIGIIGAVAIIFYSKSLIDEDASRVVPLIYIDSIFVVILAYLFLGEIFNFQKYLGIISIVIGSILISFKKTVKKWHFSSAIKFILVSAILWTITSIISKYVLSFINYSTLTVWQFTGYLIFVCLFISNNKIRKNFLTDIKSIDKKGFLLMLVNTIIYLIGVLSFYFAISISKISLVYAIVSTQPFFIFIYTFVITKIAPKIIREDIGRSTILLKIVAICLIFIGTVLIGS